LSHHFCAVDHHARISFCGSFDRHTQILLHYLFFMFLDHGGWARDDIFILLKNTQILNLSLGSIR
jgi:hypothetical protein